MANFAPTSTPTPNSKTCRYPLHKVTPLKLSSPQNVLVQHATILKNTLSDIRDDLDVISDDLSSLVDGHEEIKIQLDNLQETEYMKWTENRRRLIDANNRASKLQNGFLSHINGVIHVLYDHNSGKKIDMFPGKVEYIEWMSGDHLQKANLLSGGFTLMRIIDKSIIFILNALGEDLPADSETLKDCFKRAIGVKI